MTTATATYVKWGRPRNSWHIFEVVSPATLCGRYPQEPFDTADSLPAARSCESCLRLARRRDAAP